MTYNFTVSPDFTPDKLPGWFIFNTWLQKKLDQSIHLEIYSGFGELQQAIKQDSVDLIYANPADAVSLVRNKGFSPLVRPAAKSDETTIAVGADNPVDNVEQLQPGIRLASTNDPDVHLKGMIMLEPAELDRSNLQINRRDNYVLVAKDLIQGQADVGFFLAEAYENLAVPTRKALKVLVTSGISVVHHIMLIGPKMQIFSDVLEENLVSMTENAKDKSVLESLGLGGFENMDNEDMEFMIDLMEALGATDE